ncbi:hypothetical protein C3L33_11924, partial [Rhododendron williamsianum]
MTNVVNCQVDSSRCFATCPNGIYKLDSLLLACNRSARYPPNTFEEKTRAFSPLTHHHHHQQSTSAAAAVSFPSIQTKPQFRHAASHSPPSLPAAYRTAMEALSVTPPESASPATAEHLIVIDDGPSSPPVPENTGTETQSISSAADEGKGGDAAAAVEEVADAGDRRKVLLEELCRNVVKLPCKSIAEGGICEVSASPATAEHFISIDGPASPPLPENTSTKIQSISSAANEDRGGDMVADAGDRRKVPPEELFRKVVKLSCKSTAEGGICEVYLIGTAHVSEESCREVQAVIRFLQPQVVFLELCRSREALLFPQNLKSTFVDFTVLQSTFVGLVASKLDVFPGSEFRVAFEEACNYGAKVKFGDRPVQLKRLLHVDMCSRTPVFSAVKLLVTVGVAVAVAGICISTKK